MRAIARSRRRAAAFVVSALIAVVGGLGIAEASTAAAPTHQHSEHSEHGEH
ncbi:MAG: hypothetical protein ABIQ09_13925 [Jatrophihabitantaceae bacterium]